MNILNKIQNLPEGKRKIILWSVIIIIGLGLITFYFKNIQQRFKNFETNNLKENFKLPSFEEFKNFQLPNINK